MLILLILCLSTSSVSGNKTTSSPKALPEGDPQSLGKNTDSDHVATVSLRLRKG